MSTRTANIIAQLKATKKVIGAGKSDGFKLRMNITTYLVDGIDYQVVTYPEVGDKPTEIDVLTMFTEPDMEVVHVLMQKENEEDIILNGTEYFAYVAHTGELEVKSNKRKLWKTLALVGVGTTVALAGAAAYAALR